MSAEFIPSYPLAALRPADYNPRKLDADKFELLQESLRKFGVIKPVIINGGNGILTAGHQRTRAMKAIGLTHCPAIRLQDISRTDEIQFNLFHNSVETNKTDVDVELDDEHEPGHYGFVPWERIHYKRNGNAIVVNNMSTLILRYGGWGSIVCAEDGRVLLNSDYAVACHQLRVDCLCYVIPDEDAEEMMRYLTIDYGQYYYEALGVKSYNQLHCQMHRLRGRKKTHLIQSSLYEQHVIPTLQKEERTVDFGAGRCAYARKLAEQGYAILPYEPHYQERGYLNIRAVVEMINVLEADLRRKGLYDVVVLDSVLNSVVNSHFEHAVLTTCNALLKKGGRMYVGTRSLRFIELHDLYQTYSAHGRVLQFLDSENFSACYRSNTWTMQHFHTHASLKKLLLEYFEDVKITGREKAVQLYAVVSKPRPLPREKIRAAIDEEFNMEYPGDYRHNRQGKLVAAIMEAIGAERGFLENLNDLS